MHGQTGLHIADRHRQAAGTGGQIIAVDREGGGTRFLTEIIMAQPRPLPGADRDATGQVGKGEVGYAIAAIVRADNRKHSGVLRDRQQAAVSKMTDLKIEAECADHAEHLAGSAPSI